MAILSVLWLAAPLCAIAEADEARAQVEWPEQWVVFAPAGEAAPILSQNQLRSIPETLTVGGRTIEARAVDPVGHQYDFGPYFGADPLQQTAYVFLPLRAAEAAEVRLGFGADWWVQAWLNGEQILDTSEHGNQTWPPQIDNHVVEVSLEPGENILSVRFLSGTGSSVLAIGGPQHLEQPMPPSLAERAAAEEAPDMDAQALAERYPPREDELRPTTGWAPEFQRDVELAARERVPLRVDWGDSDVASSMVTFGVPFHRGALENVNNARIVDSEGNTAPAEFRRTATWERADGPVRWALVHAPLERGRDYFVEFGTELATPSLEGISIAEEDDAIVVDTGPMRATLSRETPSIFESVTLDWDGDGRFAPGREIVAAAQSRAELPEVVDGEGRRYVAGGREHGLKVEVVESGPNRAAVRREGRYVDEAGEAFCKFVTYTYFYAGRAGARHDHTLIVAFDTNKHQISDVVLPVPLSLARESEAFFARDASPQGNVVRLPSSAGPHSLFQTKHNAWELHAGGEATETGQRAGGWFGVEDESLGVVAGMVDFWQQYPGALQADGNVLRLHLWTSEGGSPLDFRPSAVLGEDYPHDGMRRYYAAGLDESTQAFGLGKTQNIHVNFFDATRRAEALRQTRAQVVQPVLALPDPGYVCDTEVMFGRVHPYDPERFPEVEGLIDDIVERYLEEREQREQYGWIDFGDVYYAGGRLWRRWASMFYGFPNVMPRLFLRSGRRDAWDFHRVNTRHITDIDICHLDSDEFEVDDPLRGEGLLKVKGRRYGGDGGVVHYAGGQYRIGPDQHLAFMLYDYYLNGNLRTREVAQYYIDAQVAERGEGAMVTFGGIPRQPNMGRGTGGALRMFCEAYQATWDPEYLSIMRQLADVIITAKEEIYQTDAKNVFTSYNDVYMNKGKILYYQLTGDERMREHFLHDMEVLAERRNEHALARGVGTTMSGPAHAYWFTGDKKFLPFMLYQLQVAQEYRPNWMKSAFHAVAANHGLQLPEVMAVLAQVDTLPAPQGPPTPEPVADPFGLESNWAHYLLQEEDAEFSVTAVVDLNRPRAGGDFENWPEWIGRLRGDDQPALVVLDPDGEEIERRALNAENTQGAIDLTVPADGKTGVYTLTPANLVAPLSLRVTGASLEKRMLHAGENWLRPVYGTGFHFLVPAGTESFGLELKASRVRGETRYDVRNAQGRSVAEGGWDADSTPRNEWERVQLDAGAPEDDEVWSIALNRSAETYLRFEGIPGYVASSPQELFGADAIRRHPVPAVTPPAGDDHILYQEAGLPWGAQAGYLTRPVNLAAPGDGGELFDEQRGTIELWVRTADAHSALHNRTLVTTSNMRLHRRYNIGTYLDLGGNSLQRFFALPNDRWTHLAVTWEPSEVEGFDLDIRLFGDGVEVQTPGGVPFHRVSEGWSGRTLQLHGNIYVSNLRVSDSVRYRDAFDPPESPLEPDGRTRLLCLFDGEGEAWIHGERVPLP